MSKSKQKGTAWETAVVNHLRNNGWPYAERRALAGINDKGDIFFDPEWILECKDEVKITLSEYMKEVEDEIANAGAKYGAAIVKRRYRGAGESYAVMTLDQLIRLIQDLKK